MRKVLAASLCILAGCISIRLQPETVIKNVYGEPSAKKLVPIVRIHGPILDEEMKSPFFNAPYTTPGAVLSELNYWKAQKNELAGILLHVNSPGGSAAASDIIYQSILDFKKLTGLPVVALCTEICASGAFYISCAADRIIVNPLTITGSIGVIAIFPGLQGLLNDKLGIDVVTIKSGAMKDSGSPFRKMNPEEQAYFQELIDGSFQRFKSIVLSNRKIDASLVSGATDGRVFIGEQAVKIGLADSTGGYPEAAEYYRSRAGVEVQIVARTLEGGMGGFLGAESPFAPIESIAKFCSGKPLFLHVPDLVH